MRRGPEGEWNGWVELSWGLESKNMAVFFLLQRPSGPGCLTSAVGCALALLFANWQFYFLPP